MPLESCIYKGRVRHRRFSPSEHSFSYPLFLMYLDLSELDQVFENRILWSSSRPALAQFRRSDHTGDPDIPLRQVISKLVQDRTGVKAEGPIRLLTHLRYFGYCFNPVSFYFCFDESDRFVQTIVAEVNNTPWGEQHCYVLDQKMNLGGKDRLRYRFMKEFHVSPFMDMDLEYDWRFTRPKNSLTVHMENRNAEGRFFDATMTLRRTEISTKTLNSVLLSYPFMTLQVIAAIHWNALCLWLKRCPFYTHPSKLQSEREISDHG